MNRFWWKFLNYGPAVLITAPVLWVDDWPARIAILGAGIVLLMVPARLRSVFRWGYAAGSVDTWRDMDRLPEDRRPPGFLPEPWEQRELPYFK